MSEEELHEPSEKLKCIMDWVGAEAWHWANRVRLFLRAEQREQGDVTNRTYVLLNLVICFKN